MGIIEYPNPALKQTASKADPSDPDVRRLIKDMIRVMRAAPGIGLAATQIGVQKRVIVFMPEGDDEAAALLNPVVVSSSDETCTEDEGCLSFPGIEIPIERSTEVTCEGVSPDGKSVRFEVDGLLARLFQHEVDHLDGILIIDRATTEERKAALRRYREFNE